MSDTPMHSDDDAILVPTEGEQPSEPVTTPPPASDEQTASEPSVPDAPAPSEPAALPAQVILLAGASLDTLTELLTKRRAELGRGAAEAAQQQPGTADNLIGNLYLDRMTNAEIEREEDALLQLRQRGEEAGFTQVHRVPNGPVVAPSLIPTVTAAGEGKRVSGPDGYMAFIKRMPGTRKRLTLLNSGFYIDVKMPTPAQLNDLIQSANLLVSEFGRLFGVHFYSTADVLLKRHIVELLLECITGTNLKDGQQPQVMLEHFQFPDLPATIMGLASLMYPQGYPDFQHICTNHACLHPVSTTIDLTKFLRSNYSKLSERAIALMAVPYPGSPTTKGEKVTSEQLKVYRDELGITKVLRFKQFALKMASPSLAQYFTFADAFNGELLRRHQASMTEAIESAVASRYARQFTPWIAELTAYVQEDRGDGLVDVIDPITNQPVIDHVTSDPTVIIRLLDDLQQLDRDGSFAEALENYVGEAQLTHVCYPAPACPKCGTVPETRTGYLTLDPINAFFTLCLSKSDES